MLLPLALAVAALMPSSTTTVAAPVDPFFSDQIVNAADAGWSFTNPTSVEFASDGRVFVAEKSGIIKVFDSLTDPSPTVFADLRTSVHNFWDRGLLGMTLHPNFPAVPRVYVLYTYDAAIGGSAPRWGSAGATGDGCPSPPGATTDGCVVSGRLSYLTANGSTSSGEQVLINDWCQQFPSHSIGELRFGADGALYASAGEGANFFATDWGQRGIPLNPCGDPPVGSGGTQTVPSAEGGALRSQDVRTPGDPTGLDGSIIRLNPDTGAAMAGNPAIGSPDANARRIIAYGMRNPFRFTFRPGTNDLWIGDVGWSTWEEIDRISDPTASVRNFGWPCIEGPSLHPGSYGELDLCSSLYAQGGSTAPYFAFEHDVNVAGESCVTDAGSSISGLSFYTGETYPSQFTGSLFFADYSRKCIFVMLRGANGLPDPNQVHPFINDAAGPIQLKAGPGGDIFYVDFDGGRLHRIVYTGDGPPHAVAGATPTSGTAPLHVQFNGSGSSDPNGGPLSYAWDLDGDGDFDDSSAVSPSWTYPDPGEVRVRLQVTDEDGLSDRAPVTINATGTIARYISALPFVSATNAWGPVELNQSNGEQFAGDGRTQTINGVTYHSGLGVHGVSDITLDIPPGCSTFRTTIGVDDEVGASGSVRFKVYADGASLFSSALKRGSDPGQAITLNVSGRQQLRLLVGNGGDGNAKDHADWARARLTCLAGGNTAPEPKISTPSASLNWRVGDQVSFSGSATDAEDGNLAASRLSWALVMFHCDVGCHTHQVETFDNVASGSFSAPDHEYPSYLELRLTATDSGGMSTTTARRLDPATVDLTFASSVPGLNLTVADQTHATPFTVTVIQRSKVSIGAPTPQELNGTTYHYQHWSDSGARIHTVTAPSNPKTYTATYGTTVSSTVWLSDLPFVSATNGWGPVERDQSNGEQAAGDGNPMLINGATYGNGLGVHAVSDVVFDVPDGCTTLRATIGVDDEVGAKGSVRFKVYGDGVSLFSSALKRGTDPGQAITVDVTGRSQMRLQVGNAGDGTSSDHADWARPRLTCSG